MKLDAPIELTWADALQLTSVSFLTGTILTLAVFVLYRIIRDWLYERRMRMNPRITRTLRPSIFS